MKSKEIKCPIEGVNDSMYIEVTVAPADEFINVHNGKGKGDWKITPHKVEIRYQGVVLESLEAFTDVGLITVVKAAEHTAQERLRQKHSTVALLPWIERALNSMGYN